MPAVTTGEIVRESGKSGYAVGAFNVTNIVQMEAVIAASIANQSPLILQTSVTPSKFLGPDVWGSAYRAIASRSPIPIALHLDHCTDPDYCRTCMESGYSGVMFDGSGYEFEENIRLTRLVVSYGRALGVAVEGELGVVSGVEDELIVSDEGQQLCDPTQAERFVTETGIDLFAPAIGTAHGVYKTADPQVDFDRFASIQEQLNGAGLRFPLVVHGGTGLPESTVRRLVAIGGAKLNVSTELKHVLIDALYSYIDTHRTEYNPGKVDTAVHRATIEAVTRWQTILGSVGKAGGKA